MPFLNLKKKDLYPLVERLSRMAINRRNKFKDFYGITDNNIRIYARDYDSGRTKDKSNT